MSEAVQLDPLMGEEGVVVKEEEGGGWVGADLVHESFPFSQQVSLSFFLSFLHPHLSDRRMYPD